MLANTGVRQRLDQARLNGAAHRSGAAALEHRAPPDGFPLDRAPLRRARLADLVRLAAATGEWSALVRYTEDERWYHRLERGENHEVWLLSWLPGQRTGFHDHCGSSGAFAVVQGELQERTPAAGRPGRSRPPSRPAGPGRSGRATCTRS